MTASDRVFTGAIPEIYERLMVPLIFAPYADDVARRVAARAPARVLEVAAGTGVATRALASRLPASSSIVATDLNPAMIEHAARIGTVRPVEWRAADAMSLPFDDGSFDAVVCQFGAMFFPDKAHAFGEARRVHAEGGTFVFSVWDRIEDNDFADVVTRALESVFPRDPPRFLARTPHGYFDRAAIARDVADAAFPHPARVDVVEARSVADSPRDAAVAFCQGTPLRNEIEARGASKLGNGRVDGRMQAIVVTVAA